MRNLFTGVCDTKVLHAYGFPSIRILCPRGEIPQQTGNSPRNSTRRILVCEMLAQTTTVHLSKLGPVGGARGVGGGPSACLDPRQPSSSRHPSWGSPRSRGDVGLRRLQRRCLPVSTKPSTGANEGARSRSAMCDCIGLYRVARDYARPC